LAAAGVASRRAAEDLICAGDVSVNGVTVLVPQTPVDAQRDEV
jgi:16S rRNA U516 pseudouridylate synthase RsuA-like enzyme